MFPLTLTLSLGGERGLKGNIQCAHCPSPGRKCSASVGGERGINGMSHDLIFRPGGFLMGGERGTNGMSRDRAFLRLNRMPLNGRIYGG